VAADEIVLDNSPLAAVYCDRCNSNATVQPAAPLELVMSDVSVKAGRGDPLLSRALLLGKLWPAALECKSMKRAKGVEKAFWLSVYLKYTQYV
jgi:hypothetical protein